MSAFDSYSTCQLVLMTNILRELGRRALGTLSKDSAITSERIRQKLTWSQPEVADTALHVLVRGVIQVSVHDLESKNKSIRIHFQR